MGSSSPTFGVKIKNHWNHHLVNDKAYHSVWVFPPNGPIQGTHHFEELVSCLSRLLNPESKIQFNEEIHFWIQRGPSTVKIVGHPFFGHFLRLLNLTWLEIQHTSEAQEESHRTSVSSQKAPWFLGVFFYRGALNGNRFMATLRENPAKS